jgi:hypothetical protein
LGALLSQRPEVKVSATSGLIDIMGAAATTWESLPQTRSGDASIESIYPVLRGMVDAYYPNIPVAIDKARGWPNPKIMATMEKVLGRKPRIVATVRPIAECLASFIKISKWEGTAREFVAKSPLAAHLFSSYRTLKEGWDAQPDNILFIEYCDLIDDPQMACDKIADFLDLPRWTHTLVGLSNPVPENDEKTWGIPDLHFVRPTIMRNNMNAKDVLGQKMWEFYQGGEFWNGPDPVADPGLLDLQLEAGLHGDFDKGWEIAQQAKPDDCRALFNKGWYLLRRGELHNGLVLIDQGRQENLIGHPPRSSMPQYQGQWLHGETVILQGENGNGDQIAHARFAKDIAARGGNVVIACLPDLAPVLATIEGVSAVVQANATGGVYHQFHLPMMSAARVFGYEYGDLDGSPYIRWPKTNHKGRKVGICWRGDPKMSHDEYRQFDPQVLFDLPADLVCLQQKWDGKLPDHIRQPCLDTWEKTATVIGGLDLVVTSCTAVAHLSAAMGVETWILVPLLPYYLWALPGKSSPWYSAVRLFRQDAYKDWSGAFNELTGAFTDWNESFFERALVA